MLDVTGTPAASLYSCRCLNVRIYPAAQQGAPPNNNEDSEFVQRYVGEGGIHVVHPHVTLRTRTRGLPIGSTSRCGRYTTLTCLICEVLVYRVYQIVPLDIEGKEGPLLPTEEWVENEVMKSSTGWIEVSNQCLVDDAVKALESSPDISTLFSVLVPKLQPPSPMLPANSETTGSAASPQPVVIYLEKIKPLFSPAFTPSHPVFQHLASKASEESKLLRTEAEEYISHVVKEKRAEVERAEDELRDQVETIWFKFKVTVDKIKREREKPKASPRSLAPRGNHEVEIPDSPQGPRVAIREFVPVSTPTARISPSEGPRPSALSASLATSSFHHPKAVTDAQAPVPEANGSTHSRSSSSTTDSATLIHAPPREGGSNVLQFRRTIDDALNTAVSFKYFLDLEAEIERKKKERVVAANRIFQAQAEVGPSGASEGPVVNGKQPKDKQPKEREAVRVKHQQVDTEGSIVEASEKSPAREKRHVTFDVEPEVVTINVNRNKAGLNGESGHDSRDMIFVLEDAEGEVVEQSAGPKQTLPLLEQPAARPVTRHRKVRSLASAGLPSSFLSLRPLSLPGPSHIRPLRSPNGVDSSSQTIMSSLPKQSALDHQKWLLSHKHSLAEASEDELDPRDAVILRLVAADTPSHRGAWRPDSQAWKSFTQSLGGKGRSSTDASDDEAHTGEDSLGTTDHGTSDSTELSSDENGDYDQPRAGVSESLPIPISQFARRRQPLSLASYQPKTSLTERAGTVVPPSASKPLSSATLRRASYAERDRKRAMDPGALDFTAEEDENESEASEEETEVAEDDMGTRSRKRALKILQKSSEVPEEGMWRSLAT